MRFYLCDGVRERLSGAFREDLAAGLPDTRDRAAAEDVAAEALSRAWADWPRVSGFAHRDAWVLRVATNLALDQARRPTRPPERVDATAEDELVVLRLALVEALRALPTRQRQAIALRYFGDLTSAQVAQALGISAGSAKTHIHRGLAALRVQLAQDAGEPLTIIREETMRVRSLDGAKRAMEEGRILTGRVVGWVNSERRPGWGWLHVDVGVPARLLTRHAGFSIGEDYGWLIGHDVDVRVIAVDEEEGCVDVSRRAVLENEHVLALRRALLESLPVGETRLGRVTLVLPFGAFVDLGGVFGLLPAAEFARPDASPDELKRHNEPECREPVARGRGVSVEIVSVDLARGRAALRLPAGRRDLSSPAPALIQTSARTSEGDR